MSISSNAVRNLPRHRAAAKTLLPFLYQTTTIQQWMRATSQAVRRNIATRPEGSDDIPFEDESLPPTLEEVPIRKSTITGSERAAFQNLYRRFDTSNHPNSRSNNTVVTDRINNGYTPDDEERSGQSLDKIFDTAMKGSSQLRAYQDDVQRLSTRVTRSAQSSLTDAAKAKIEKVQNKREKAKLATAKFKQLKIGERARVDELLQSAKTDKELWQILDREILEKIRNLELDGPAGQQSVQIAKARTDTMTSESRIVFQNFPHHLNTAVAILRDNFPSSHLPLTILPTIKALGRSSYALGATTSLYCQLIRTAWIQQSSYSYIDALLVEMDNSAIEFHSTILSLLGAIIKEHEMARSGRLGGEMQLVYVMDQILEDIKKIRQWRSVIAERLGVTLEHRHPAPQVSRRGEPQPRPLDHPVPLGDHVVMQDALEAARGDSVFGSSSE
ncbi:hypothetical protein ACN47E_010331 [Coniothyrium glycines]